jgi:hypothetical protein
VVQVTHIRTIRVDPDGEIARFLRCADEDAVLVETDGAVFHVTRVPSNRDALFVKYDVRAVQSALKRSAGAFADFNTAELKQELRAQRQQDSIGRPSDGHVIPD